MELNGDFRMRASQIHAELGPKLGGQNTVVRSGQDDDCLDSNGYNGVWKLRVVDAQI